jgi:hypothetical protein
MTYTATCPICGEENTLEIDPAAFDAWTSGALIQDCFPDLTLNERELIMTGIDQRCWETL